MSGVLSANPKFGLLDSSVSERLSVVSRHEQQEFGRAPPLSHIMSPKMRMRHCFTLSYYLCISGVNWLS